ncbi:MAG: 3-dehydroquinate synthase [Flavobacteriia bacterium]|nr:3-dehydroquinate synthase [Flavobacteriia bacterium]
MIKNIASEYPIELGSLLNSSFHNLLKNKYKNSKIVIIVDENSHDFCLEFLITSFDELKEAEVMLLPTGEENKVMEVCFQVWEALSDYQIGRKDLIINLGGGIVTDMGGFIASIFKRGIDFINIPTTLLGMIDASIGGKTGIDLGPYKNQLGTFTNPKALFIDSSFLGTLPKHELMNGYAEMLKHALICDANHWNELIAIEALEDLITGAFIEKSIRIKNQIVSEDPKEANVRKKLNFGHTIGHGIEGYLLDKEPISHGHAVGLGMLAEAFISYQRRILSEEQWLEIERILTAVFPKIEIESTEIENIISLMQNDKKNFSGEIKGCVLTSIGNCEFDQNFGNKEIEEALNYLINI